MYENNNPNKLFSKQTTFSTQVTDEKLLNDVVEINKEINEEIVFSENQNSINDKNSCDSIICLNDIVSEDNNVKNFQFGEGEIENDLNGWTVKTLAIQKCDIRSIFENKRHT